jgi:hypothetical protein
VNAGTYAIRKRLAWRLSALVTGVLALLAAAVFGAVLWVVQNRLATELGKKFNVVSAIMIDSAKAGGMARVRDDMVSGAYRRPMTRLTITTAGGHVFYRDPDEPLFVMTGPGCRAPASSTFRPTAANACA